MEERERERENEVSILVLISFTILDQTLARSTIVKKKTLIRYAALQMRPRIYTGGSRRLEKTIEEEKEKKKKKK